MATRFARLTLPLVLVVGLAGCSSDDGEIAAVSSTTAKAARTTTTDGGATTTTDGSKTTVATSDDAWAATAIEHRGEDGATFEQECTPNPDEVAGSVWGAGTYTDDSSICTAAVQSGLITFAEGGTVTYEIVAGQDRYAGGEANGVRSASYPAWAGSFEFPDAPPGSVDMGADVVEWSTPANSLGVAVGDQLTVTCPPNGTAGSVWGSGPYTGDSSVCTAAAHTGAITLADGGQVTFEMGPGQPSYSGTAANGVTTGDWGAYDPSFTIVDA